MSHARIEEVEDSDPSDFDPNDFDPVDFAQNEILKPVTSVARQSSPAPAPAPQRAPPPTAATQVPKQEIPKGWQCLYAVYFDKSRSKREGRRVGKHLAVENPLAYDVLMAVSRLGLGLQVGFEPDKLHPKDWGNPGRIRFLLKEDGELVKGSKVKNKQHLYDLVGQYLKENPTTTQSPLKLQLRGFPNPPEALKRPEAPRGWKIGTILPSHSPANSWGGVSNNPLKDAMKEMQGVPGFPGLPGMGMDEPSQPEPKKKKEKKKGKA